MKNVFSTIIVILVLLLLIAPIIIVSDYKPVDTEVGIYMDYLAGVLFL